MSKRDITEKPGKKEAVAILRDFEIAHNGVRAWFKVGLRLIDVKERLPHGEFMKWVDANLTPCQIWGIRQIFRAKRVADGLLKEAGLLPTDALKVADNDEHSLWAAIEGQTRKDLLLTVQDVEQSEKELEAKKWCIEKWEAKPKLREEWQPRVLSGELTYYYAKCGMLGKEVETPKKRPATDHAEYLESNINALSRHWKRGWESLDEEWKDEFKDRFIQLIDEAPEDLKRAVANFITGGDQHD